MLLNWFLYRWKDYEDAREALQKWLRNTEKQIPSQLELRSTLDEKRSQLQTYRLLLHDVVTHKQVLLDCRDKAENLPDATENGKKEVDNFLHETSKKHQELLLKIQVEINFLSIFLCKTEKKEKIKKKRSSLLWDGC